MIPAMCRRYRHWYARVQDNLAGMGVAILSAVSRSAGGFRGLQDLTLDGNPRQSNGF